MERTRVFGRGALSSPRVDCRIANLGHETTISWFSHRAGKMVHILSGCSFPSVDG
jgi:hypothetical protein